MMVYRLSGYPLDLNSRGAAGKQFTVCASLFLPRNRARTARHIKRNRQWSRRATLSVYRHRACNSARLFTVEILFTIVLTRSRMKGLIPQRWWWWLAMVVVVAAAAATAVTAVVNRVLRTRARSLARDALSVSVSENPRGALLECAAIFKRRTLAYTRAPVRSLPGEYL